MAYDLNDAEQQGGSVIPADLYWLTAKVKPGGASDDYNLRRSKNGALEMLELEMTVVGGPHAGARFWEMMPLNYVDGSCPDQAQVNRYKAAVRMGKAKLRAIIESARQIDPDDASEQAQQQRRLADLNDLNGLTCFAQVDVREQSGYRPKNYIDYVITPKMPEWPNGGQPTAVAPFAGAKAAFDDEIPF